MVASSERGFFRPVLQVDHQRWGQTVADLRDLALSAPHPRSRERFLALHEIADGRCATTVAERTGRRAQTVMGWLHAYNEHGPEALTYQRTGGRPPFARTLPPHLASRFAPQNARRPVRRLPEPR
jgi:Homeodomain-like domain